MFPSGVGEGKIAMLRLDGSVSGSEWGGEGGAMENDGGGKSCCREGMGVLFDVDADAVDGIDVEFDVDIVFEGNGGEVSSSGSSMGGSSGFEVEEECDRDQPGIDGREGSSYGRSASCKAER